MEYILALVLPAGLFVSMPVVYSLLIEEVVTPQDEALYQWVSSVVDEDGNEEIIVEAGCIEEIHDGSVTVSAPCESVPPPSAVSVSYEANGRAIGPINTSMPESPNVGWMTKDMDEAQLRWMLYDKGFRHLAGMNEAKLRQLYITYSYEPFFWRIHERVGLPVSVVAAYFIVEATRQGVESELLREHYNPGGVKYRGVGSIAYFHDDCYDSNGKKIPCRFESLNGYEQMEETWAAVFNKPRYRKCKTYATVEDICHCLYRAGYHTGNNWKLRANVARRYWVYRSKFPRPELVAAKNN